MLPSFHPISLTVGVVAGVLLAVLVPKVYAAGTAFVAYVKRKLAERKAAKAANDA